MKMRIAFLTLALGALPAAASAQVAPAGVPDTGIGPAPTGVVPGGVVPVPSPSTTPTPDLTPPSPIPPPTGAALTPPTGASLAPPLPGQRPIGPRTINTTFTEQQIRSNLMAQGYTGISGLSVDGSGTWRGTAVRNGSNVPVTVDSNGMVTPR